MYDVQQKQNNNDSRGAAGADWAVEYMVEWINRN